MATYNAHSTPDTGHPLAAVPEWSHLLLHLSCPRPDGSHRCVLSYPPHLSPMPPPSCEGGRERACVGGIPGHYEGFQMVLGNQRLQSMCTFHVHEPLGRSRVTCFSHNNFSQQEARTTPFCAARLHVSLTQRKAKLCKQTVLWERDSCSWSFNCYCTLAMIK